MSSLRTDHIHVYIHLTDHMLTGTTYYLSWSRSVEMTTAATVERAKCTCVFHFIYFPSVNPYKITQSIWIWKSSYLLGLGSDNKSVFNTIWLLNMIAYEAMLEYSHHGRTNVPAPKNLDLYPVAGRKCREHLKE